MLSLLWFFIAQALSAIISDQSKEPTPLPARTKLNLKDPGWIGLTVVLGIILIIILCILVYIVIILCLDFKKTDVVQIEEE